MHTIEEQARTAWSTVTSIPFTLFGRFEREPQPDEQHVRCSQRFDSGVKNVPLVENIVRHQIHAIRRNGRDACIQRPSQRDTFWPGSHIDDDPIAVHTLTNWRLFDDSFRLISIDEREVVGQFRSRAARDCREPGRNMW